jgi:hypothetical protein
LNPHTLFLCFEGQRTFAALHLVLPMPQILLNPVKEWWRYGAETRERHYQIFNHSKWSKNEEDMRLKLEKGLELFFQKYLKQTITHPFPVFSAFLLYF